MIFLGFNLLPEYIVTSSSVRPSNLGYAFMVNIQPGFDSNRLVRLIFEGTIYCKNKHLL
jgi:hypothetical protein